MKRVFAILLAILMFCPCALAEEMRVVSLYGSFAEAWQLAGGRLVGVTEDAVSERGLVADDIAIIGTTKKPNLELIVDLEPDLVLYSTEIEGQSAAAEQLEQMGIPCEGYHVNSYREYLNMMRAFCDRTGRDDLYEVQVQKVEAPIESCIARAQADERFGTRTVLLLRAFANGVKSKGSDNLAGVMLKDLGMINIADSDRTMLENLTLEAILESDPDYIFVVVMGGDEAEALQSFANAFSDNPAWEMLTAVQNGRYIVLDRNLFHLKPNERWGESYETLQAILYDE